MSPLSKNPCLRCCAGIYKVGGSRVLLSSALTTAVRGCREALMSCIMGVRRDAGMEGKSEGAETRSLPCAALRCAAQTVGEG